MEYICSEREICKKYIAHSFPCWDEDAHGKSIWCDDRNNCELNNKRLQYKAEAEGIKVKLQQESHTSKCSFLDSEPICHQEKYKGVRVSRGLFRSANGTILNSDVNGAYNIIRKAIPDAFAKGIEGVGLHPIRSNTL